MNYNPRMGFNEQDYHLLKTHQSSGSKPKVGYFNQKGWVVKTLNPAYNENVGGKVGIPVNKITVSVDPDGDNENLPVGTQMLVYAR